MQKLNALTDRERLRRVVLLCCHFTRNLAYYRAWHDRLSESNYSQLLATIDGNFLDMAVFEWCKLLGDEKGKHYWKNVVRIQDFEGNMLNHLGQSSDEFVSYKQKMREYRDKFLAHLDDQRIMHIPKLDKAKAAVDFYHNWVVQYEALPNDLAGLPTDLTTYYQQCSAEALAAQISLIGSDRCLLPE